MRIQRVEAWILGTPDDRAEEAHWVSHYPVPRANELLVRVHAEDGTEGFGLASSNGPLDAAAAVLRDGVAARLAGADALAPERVYEQVFSLTYQRESFEKGWSRGALTLAAAALDIALWDLLGKAAGLPLFRLFGGHRRRVPCYVTCAYYRRGKDLAALRDEMQMLKAQGHRAYKAKIGGLSLAEDAERIAVVREVIGDEALLMLDVNGGWDLATAIDGAGVMEAFSPRWLEEPVPWYDDRRQLRVLAGHTRIPLSAGESETTPQGCRALLEEQAVRVLQFDCTRMGGFTMGRKLAALAELNNVEVAPHHDCFLHAHLVAASPAGLIVEAFTDPERDPLQATLYADAPLIADGHLELPERPGLGLTLAPETLARYGRRVV